MERVGNVLLQSLIRVAVALAFVVLGLIGIALLAEVQATRIQASTIIESVGSSGPSVGWHPPLLL